MPNDFQINGAQSSRQSRFAPLFNNYFATGLVSQRSPLRPGNETALTNKYYGSRNDSLLDGLNVEVSNRLTLTRRPGSSVYNSQTFPSILDFYEFRTFDSNTEDIKVMADTASVIYDATGPSTKTAVFTKSPGAGQAYFQSVGNTLYFGDGVDQKKWIQSAQSWAPGIFFDTGQYLVDSNGNIQAVDSGVNATVSILTSEIKSRFIPGGGLQFFANLQLANPVAAVTGQNVTFSGLTVATILNNQTYPVQVNLGSSTSISVILTGYLGPAQTLSPDSGSVTFAVVPIHGITGFTPPIWNTTRGGTTLDGGLTWLNKGSALENWGIVAPTKAPMITQQPLAGTYPVWAMGTYYSTSLVVKPSGAGNLQMLTTSGVTGGSEPTWNNTVGGTTTDGTAVWTNVNGFHVISTAYGVGDIVFGNDFIGGGAYIFRCIQAGTTATTDPIWPPTPFSLVNDGTVTWQNVGPLVAWPVIGTGVAVSTDQTILDSNGFLENIASSGISGGSVPMWNTFPTGLTPDNTAVWSNGGPFAAAATQPAFYAYDYNNSVVGTTSNASPVSVAFLIGAGKQAVIQGIGSADPQVDTIDIYRSVMGGSSAILLLVGTVPNPGAGVIWTFIDAVPDTGLNAEVLANVALSASPPPAGLGKLTYHLGRIWGVVNNSVYFSAGPDLTNGNGNEAFPPANVFVFPDQVNRLFATTQGLFVFTVSDIYVIQGTTTQSFFSVPFLIGVGLPSYNAFSINGSTPYLFTSDFQIVTLDMTGGVNEVGFNIGDQFLKPNWDSSKVRVSYHIAGSTDKGLYVSDFSNGWFRLYPTPAPETGQTWAPFAEIVGGCSAVQSVQTSSGVHNLLIGPQTSGPILKRDDTVYTDNGQNYDAFALIGSIVLAQPGQLAEIVFIATDSVAVGNRPLISVQLDEIAPFSAGMFEPLPAFVSDPTELAPSVSMFSNRYYLSQTQQPALGRSLQIRLDWGNDQVQNELLSLTVFGGFFFGAVNA